MSSSALTEPTFTGHRPSGAGDLSVETHGIAPIPEDQRYGSPARLFTVWFAPQVNMTGVFTGALAIVLGLGFWLGLLAMVIGTVLGSLDGRIPVDVGPADGHRSAAELADGVWRRRRVARRSAMAGDDRVGRAGRAVRWGSAFGAARHPVLARGADRARLCRARRDSSATRSSTGCRRC